MAIESRDDLPSPEAFRVKIIEEHDAHRNHRISGSTAMFARSFQKSSQQNNGKSGNKKGNKSKKTKVKCSFCHLLGHLEANCPKKPGEASSESTDSSSLYIGEAFLTVPADRTHNWCLDSRATTHLCCDAGVLETGDFTKREKLKLAKATPRKIRLQA